MTYPERKVFLERAGVATGTQDGEEQEPSRRK